MVSLEPSARVDRAKQEETDEVVSETIKISDLCFCYFKRCIVFSWIIAILHKEEVVSIILPFEGHYNSKKGFL